MTEELLNTLEEETLRELKHAKALGVESDAHDAVMTKVRENCKVIYEGVKANNEQYLMLEELEFKRQTKMIDVSEHRKDRWIDFGKGAMTVVVPLVAYGAMYKLGLVFEEHGAVSSTFFRNLLSKWKPN